MGDFELKLCDIQGRLFELSADAGFDSTSFIEAFMPSAVARALDSRYNHMQWAGEEYLLDELSDRVPIAKGGEIFPKDTLYWMGYLYRYWHLMTGESSARIFEIAPVKTVKRNYLMFHTMAPELAVENFREIYSQKKKPRS